MSSLGTVFVVSAALLIAVFLAVTRQPRPDAWSSKTPNGVVVLCVALAVVALLAGIMLAITHLLSRASP
jgi:hypothetical protein